MAAVRGELGRLVRVSIVFSVSLRKPNQGTRVYPVLGDYCFVVIGLWAFKDATFQVNACWFFNLSLLASIYRIFLRELFVNLWLKLV